MGFTDDEPLTPADTPEEVLDRYHNSRGDEGDIMAYALARSPPAHRGARYDPPLKPTSNKFVDLTNDSDLFAEIMS
jgi:hypothetical protein